MMKTMCLFLNCALLEVCFLLILVNQRKRVRRIAATNTIITKTYQFTKHRLQLIITLFDFINSPHLRNCTNTTTQVLFQCNIAICWRPTTKPTILETITEENIQHGNDVIKQTNDSPSCRLYQMTSYNKPEMQEPIVCPSQR